MPLTLDLHSRLRSEARQLDRVSGWTVSPAGPRNAWKSEHQERAFREHSRIGRRTQGVTSTSCIVSWAAQRSEPASCAVDSVNPYPVARQHSGPLRLPRPVRRRHGDASARQSEA